MVKQANLEDRISIDSAGTHAYHVGNSPDPRAQEAARKRNIDLSKQRARRVNTDDFTKFDYIIAMDESNRDELLAICPAGYEDRIHLFLDFAGCEETEVPDPYYGQGRGFEIVLNLVEEASEGLLNHLRKNT
jgi:protein-tyrosine phosphatase